MEKKSSYKKDPLSILIKLDKESRDFGFNWQNYESILNQIKSECEEVREAITSSQNTIEEEVGDLLHSLISLCIFLDLDVDKIILQAAKKYKHRMRILKDILRTEFNLTNLRNQSTEVKVTVWKKAKEKHKTKLYELKRIL